VSGIHRMCGLCECLTEIVRQQIAKRSIRVFTGIGRQLRQGDFSGDGLLNKYELEKSLVDFHITVPQDVSYLSYQLSIQYLATDWVVGFCYAFAFIDLQAAVKFSMLLHCTLASCGAVYCNRSCLWVCGGRAGSVRTLLQPARAVFASLWALFSFSL